MQQPGCKASVSLPQTYQSSITCSDGNVGLYYHIFATEAFRGSSTISSSIISISDTEALHSASALLIHTILAFIYGFSYCAAASASSTSLCPFQDMLASSVPLITATDPKASARIKNKQVEKVDDEKSMDKKWASLFGGK